MVMWRAGGHTGQSIVNVNDVMMETNDNDTKQCPQYPVRINVTLETSDLCHDFVSSKCCHVHGSIRLSSSSASVMCQHTVREQVKGARITGNKDGLVFLQAGEEKVLQFAVVVTRPGFYHLNNFLLRAKEMVRIKLFGCS